MAYTFYGPGTTPQYFRSQFYSVLPPSAAYVSSPAPDPIDGHHKLRKRQNRWSLPGYTQLAQSYPLTPPPTPAKPRRVLWEADYMWAPTSSRHQNVHPVLATDTTRVNFDVRLPPEKGISPGAYTRFWNSSALRQPTMHMRLVSQEHPWVFELDFRRLATGGTPHYVTCGDIWTALASGLSQPVTDAEWTLLVTADRPEQSQRRKILMEIVAMRKYEHGKYLRRADWLGRKVIFCGLTKDDNFARNVLLPGREPCLETWVVKFGEIRV